MKSKAIRERCEEEKTLEKQTEQNWYKFISKNLILINEANPNIYKGVFECLAVVLDLISFIW